MKSAYQRVLDARDVERLSASEVIAYLSDYFIELHGDRRIEEDAALIGGVARLKNGQAATILGIQKGRSTEENLKRYFGSVGPSGYYKAIRLIEQADRFNRPIITLINTAGARATEEAERHGIGGAIAECLLALSKVKVPTLAIILGEGGSGGALALALTDEVWMLENSIYSILSPEGFASILWKDSALAAQAAEEMKLTAEELLDLSVADRVVLEQDPNSHGRLSKEDLGLKLSQQIMDKIKELKAMDPEVRYQKRYDRFRQF